MSVRVDVDVDEAAVARLVADVVDEVTAEVANAARRRAPVDRGQLRASIRSETRQHGSQVVGEVWSSLEYAAYVHQGTGIYGPAGRPIRPRRARVLSWEPSGGGGRVYAREVRGQRPQPWLLEALREVAPGPVDETVRY
ncbi:HK97 gp10 family phage protein [Streptomyces boncukensis]|uniref:HK97 gp10 family phage protein n=1 Tax=Streptomyces boncukensis TaxID=2711219 RepID=A0A6G4X6A0_9ACTN|nr:HK97 gp10 family phage protein [Streptomyces boncukensis]NGO72274.1 HK97 gp10 family phage protein [Streptomyces boncukensis]